MPWVRISAWILCGFLGLVAIAAGAVWLGGGPALAWVIEHPLSSMIGRQIYVGGKLSIEWGAPTRIIIEDLHVANASWGSQPEMFSAQRLEVDVSIPSLLLGPTRIPSIGVDGARLLLETSHHGERNWDFGLSSTAPQKRRQFPELEKFVLRSGDLRYLDGMHKGGHRFRSGAGANRGARSPEPGQDCGRG